MPTNETRGASMLSPQLIGCWETWRLEVTRIKVRKSSELPVHRPEPPPTIEAISEAAV